MWITVGSKSLPVSRHNKAGRYAPKIVPAQRPIMTPLNEGKQSPAIIVRIDVRGPATSDCLTLTTSGVCVRES